MVFVLSLCIHMLSLILFWYFSQYRQVYFIIDPYVSSTEHNGVPVNNQNFEALWLDKYIYNNTWRGIVYENEVNRECKRKLHNWKAPGKDGFYNYWLMSLTNLLRFNPHNMLSKGKARRMIEGRTVFFNFVLALCARSW